MSEPSTDDGMSPDTSHLEYDMADGSFLEGPKLEMEGGHQLGRYLLSTRKIIESSALDGDLAKSGNQNFKQFDQMRDLFYSEGRTVEAPARNLSPTDAKDETSEKERNAELEEMQCDSKQESSISGSSSPLPGKSQSPTPPANEKDDQNNKSSKDKLAASAANKKPKYRHVTSRIDTGVKKTIKQENTRRKSDSSDVPKDSAMQIESPPPSTSGADKKKRVHFEPTTKDKSDSETKASKLPERQISQDDVGQQQGILFPVDFQETTSYVKKYIRGEASARPSVVHQKTADAVGMQTDDYKAQPLLAVCGELIPEKGYLPPIPVKDTIASRKRLEKLHLENQCRLEKIEQEEQIYMTPLQRKDLTIKELNRQLEEACMMIEQREMELDAFHQNKDREVQDIIDEKDDLIRELREHVTKLRREREELANIQAEAMRRVEELENTIQQVKRDQEDRERRHQEIYLDMYKKGRESASFEREDEIETSTRDDIDRNRINDILNQLATTQQELERWQTMRPGESSDSRNVVSETEADAVLNFMKDSMYHYLTENRRESIDQHLKAMIGIFQFSECQLKHINKSLEERRRKGRL